jgi:transposase-like protein
MRTRRTSKHRGQERRRTVEQRTEAVARYIESGLGQRDFAREEGIGVSTLQLWLRQVRANAGKAAQRGSRPPAAGGRSAPLRLLEVELAGGSGKSREEPLGNGIYEVELRGGTRLRLGARFSEMEVRQLLAVLQEVD